MVSRLGAAGAVLWILVGMPALALAEWKPAKPIEFVVMAGPGGGADKATRFLAELIKTKQLTGQPINVVNVAGNSGGDALQMLQKRTGDDHLIAFTLNSFYTTPILHPEIGVDVAKFSPLGRLAEDVFLLWVHKDRADINTIEDFVAAAKAKGDKWVMAGTGLGAEDQMLTEFLNATYGLQMTYQDKGGGGEVAKQLAEKRADSTVNNPSEQSEFHPKGITKPIVAFTPQRLKAYASVPTLRETGMDFTYFMQRTVVGAPGMSAEARAWYEAMFRALYDSEEWKKYREKNSLFGEFLAGGPLLNYWMIEREKHQRWRMAIEIMKLGGPAPSMAAPAPAPAKAAVRPPPATTGTVPAPTAATRPPQKK